MTYQPNRKPNIPGPQGVRSADVGWVEVGTEFTQRSAIIALWGPTSGGKTTLALTSKGPTAILHAAEKVKGIIEPHVRKGKMVREFNFGFTAVKDEKTCAERARQVWGKWEKLYDDAMDKWAGTVIVDTEPDAYALRRFARFGTLTPQGDTRDLYNMINFDWKQIFKNRPREQAEKRGVNLITIHTASDEYKDILKKNSAGVMKKVSERTGRYKMDGHKDIKYNADVILWCDRDVEGKYQARIDKPWWRGEVQGVELTEETMRNLGYTVSPATGSALTIPAILAFITETEEKEWV